MLKLKPRHLAYIAAMAAVYGALELAGVSDGDKFALSAIFGAVAPLCFPKLSERLFSRN